MASLKRIWTLSLACGGLLFCSQAVAQIAPGTGDNGPTAITADKAEQFQDKHMYVWTGSVEVVQNGARLVSDKLTAYTYGPGEGPDVQAKPAAPKGAAGSGQDELSTGSIKQMIAEGHVFYVTQNENVRGDNGVYDAAPDTITMTGNVIAVQGKNVVRGDKMVMNRKTGQTTVFSNATGRSNPNRVRAVIYNDNQNSQGEGAQAQGAQGQKAQGQNTAKAPPAPAKKP